MKKYLLLFAIPSLLFFISCGNEQPEPTEAAIPQGWTQLDLGQEDSHYSLNMYVNVPDENKANGTPEIMEGPFGGTQVKIGTVFNFEITPGGQTITEKKEEIEGNPILKITYLIDEADGILYKSEIEDAGVAQFHFYSVRNVGAVTYGIEDIKDEPFPEELVKQMYESAKSLRLK